jgi:hypothetical protein
MVFEAFPIRSKQAPAICRAAGEPHRSRLMAVRDPKATWLPELGRAAAIVDACDSKGAHAKVWKWRDFAFRA